MTTVGYGDRTPKSFLGRVYASLWMIVGLLLMSCITAQISSTITTDGLRPLDEEFGYKIGVPYGSKEFFETHSEGGKLKEYLTENDLFQSLDDGKVDKIWLFDCQKSGENQHFKIVKVLGVSPVIAAEIKLVRPKHKIKKQFCKCLKRWAQNEKTDGDNVDDDEDEDEEEEEREGALLEQVASAILGEKEWESQKPEQQVQCIENHSHNKYQDAKWSSPQTQMELIDILLCIAGGLLITLLTTGALWDSFVKIRQARKDNCADLEKAAGTQELKSTEVILN